MKRSIMFFHYFSSTHQTYKFLEIVYCFAKRIYLKTNSKDTLHIIWEIPYRFQAVWLKINTAKTFYEFTMGISMIHRKHITNAYLIHVMNILSFFRCMWKMEMTTFIQCYQKIHLCDSLIWLINISPVWNGLFSQLKKKTGGRGGGIVGPSKTQKTATFLLLLLDHAFWLNTPSLTGYRGNKKWPIFNILIWKDALNDFLKSDISLKIGWTVSEILRKNRGGGGILVSLVHINTSGVILASSGFSWITQEGEKIFQWKVICS